LEGLASGSHYLDNYSRPLVSLPDGFRSALSCHGDLLNGPSSVDVTPVGYCPHISACLVKSSSAVLHGLDALLLQPCEESE